MNFDFGEVLSRAWQIFRKNIGLGRNDGFNEIRLDFDLQAFDAQSKIAATSTGSDIMKASQ